MPRRPTPPPAHVRQWFAKQGQRGGETTAERMTPEQRSAKASKAASARWAKARGEQPPQDVNPKPVPAPQSTVDASITLPADLAHRLDALQARMGLPSRQSALEIALRAGLGSLGG